MRTSRAITVAAATLAVLGLSVSPAQADFNENDYKNLQSDEACKEPIVSGFKFHIYYNSGLNGSWRNIGWPVYNFNYIDLGYGNVYTLDFCWIGVSNPLPGSGQQIKNNAAGGWNTHSSYTANVYYNSGYKGNADIMWPGAHHDQFSNGLYNQNASFNWTS